MMESFRLASCNGKILQLFEHFEKYKDSREIIGAWLDGKVYWQGKTSSQTDPSYFYVFQKLLLIWSLKICKEAYLKPLFTFAGKNYLLKLAKSLSLQQAARSHDVLLERYLFWWLNICDHNNEFTVTFTGNQIKTSC